MITAIKKMYPVVKELLGTYPATRDCDRKLLMKVWQHQYPYLDSMFVNFSQFKNAFEGGNLANPSSVRRARAKVQEEHEELRGERYGKRKVLAKEVQTEIND